MNLIEKLSSIIIKFILLLLFVLIVFSFYRILGIHLGYLNKETFFSGKLFITTIYNNINILCYSCVANLELQKKSF